MNLKMLDLKSCLEEAGFTNVVTVISSGNVVFDSRSSSIKNLEKKVELALEKNLGRSFLTFVRSVDELVELIEADHFGKFKFDSVSKPVVTFFKTPIELKLKLPISKDGGSILKIQAGEAFAVYLPNTTKGSNFMILLEKTFGKDITTRTLETVRKVTKK